MRDVILAGSQGPIKMPPLPGAFIIIPTSINSFSQVSELFPLPTIHRHER